MMVHRAVVVSKDGVYDDDISAVSLLVDEIVHVVTLFELRMPPSILLSGRKLEDDIGYERLMLSTYTKKAKLIVTAVSMDPIFDHWNITLQHHSPHRH